MKKVFLTILEVIVTCLFHEFTSLNGLINNIF